MAEKKAKVVAKTEPERYLEAKKLTDAIPCLIRDKEKAEIYENIAKIYEGLGDYEDSSVLCEEAKRKGKQYREQIHTSFIMHIGKHYNGKYCCKNNCYKNE